MDADATNRREFAQTLLIGLSLQAELIAALVREGALSRGSAQAMATKIRIIDSAWSRYFEDGRGVMAAGLQDLDDALAAPRE